MIQISRQLFFAPDGEFRPRLKPLSRNQKRVLSLLNAELLQADIARKLHVSKPYVCQIVKGLESLKLISRRGFTYFYYLSPEAKSLLSGVSTLDEYTPARIHNFKKKFRILSGSHIPFTNKENGDPEERVHYNGSWKMRGPLRHKFWYPGEKGIPSVTVDYHIKTLVIYIDKGQQILARSVEEATELGWLAIQKARDAWIREQHLFNVDFAVEEAGTPIGKVHAGFVMRDTDPLIKEVLQNDGKVGYSDYWVDKSPEKELGPGHCEAETELSENMTRLGRGIQVIESIQPEIFKELEKLGPLTSEVHTVIAHIQSGQPVQNQVNQLVMMFGKMLEQQHQIMQMVTQNTITVKKSDTTQTNLF